MEAQKQRCMKLEQDLEDAVRTSDELSHDNHEVPKLKDLSLKLQRDNTECPSKT